MYALFSFCVLIAREAYHGITYPFLSLFIKPFPITRTKKSLGTILIVESWFQSNPYHRIWMEYLERKGFHTILINFPNMMQSYTATARKLDAYIRRYHLKDFTLVGISNGALLCLCYLQEYDGWKNIKHFVSVGAPFHGTRLALFIAFTKKGRDMLPGSAFIQKLLARPIQKDKIITLSAKFDELTPKTSSTLSGVRSYTLGAIGHNNFHLDYQKTYDFIAQIAGGKL